MSYVSLNDLITDEEILTLAKQYIENNKFTIPSTTIGKTTLSMRIQCAILYLIGEKLACLKAANQTIADGD